MNTQITWNDLFTQGTLIDYSTHIWRARIRLTAEDLGIDMTDDVQKAFSFGCHRLAPASAFEAINSAVNGYVNDIMEHSLNFPLLQGVRYVPDSEVKPLQKKLDMRLREFNIAVEEFLAQYDSMMQEMLPVLEQALKEAAKTPEAAFNALSRVTREYPSSEKVAAKFGLEWSFFTIAIPSSKEAADTAKSSIPQVQKVITSMVEQLRNELSASPPRPTRSRRRPRKGRPWREAGGGSGRGTGRTPYPCSGTGASRSPGRC